jgi:hypothetical protein
LWVCTTLNTGEAICVDRSQQLHRPQSKDGRQVLSQILIPHHVPGGGADGDDIRPAVAVDIGHGNS